MDESSKIFQNPEVLKIQILVCVQNISDPVFIGSEKTLKFSSVNGQNKLCLIAKQVLIIIIFRAIYFDVNLPINRTTDNRCL